MRAESPGPSVSKLVPRIKTTALILYLIYVVLTSIEFILLLCGRMTVFEALCTAFSTAGTGGFGIKNDSFASFSSYIQIVVTIFMFLFSINFASFYLILLRRFKEALTTEVKTFLGVVAVTVTLIAINTQGLFASLGEALKHIFFTVASLISTCGFATVDFNEWPELSRFLIIVLMFIGGCAGSTAGGLKVSRVTLALKNVSRNIRKMIRPKSVSVVRLDGEVQSLDTLHAVSNHVVLYVAILALTTLLISVDGFDLETNFTATLSCLSNIGPGLGAVGPMGNFGGYSYFSKVLLSFVMLFGRLEFIPMMILFSPTTWKKH
jgi:trk system potassium uptake protein TrkH